MGIYIAIGIGALLLILIAVVIVRTLLFTTRTAKEASAEDVYVNAEKALLDLAEMVRCKTVSHHDEKMDDEAEFVKFKELLQRLFPNIFEKCEYTEVGNRAILFKYEGSSHSEPTVLMAHYDVVSVEEEQWEKPPFNGIIEKGVLWGRGTLDTKGTLNGAMQALEMLIAEGFVPQNDIYLAFSGNEEVNGNGAPTIVDLFEKNGITPGLVLDEGGAVVSNVFPGVKEPCALVGIAEKGMLNVRFSFNGNGGHSSSPKPHTPVGLLSKTCVNIEDHPFKFRVCEATSAMFDTLARHSSFVYRMIFSNLWLFSPILDLICKKSGGELNALLRTTCAFTQMEGSKGMNVIPANAEMVANLRILPGETKDSALEYLRKRIPVSDIEINEIYGVDPSVTSDIGTDGWKRVESAINATWRDAIVSPYLMFACSDSRHWGRISRKVYRFSAMALTKEERGTIHGNNERVVADTVKKTVEFYVRLIRSC